MFDFSGKVVFITGATGNLGSAAARGFSKSGAALVLHGRDMAKLNDLLKTLDHLTRHVLVTANLLNENEVKSAVEDVVNRLGKIDILVNTLGGYRAGTPVHDTSLMDWDAMMDLNVRSAFVASKTVAPFMIQRKFGKMIFVASRSGFLSRGKDAAYSASKSAVLRLTESMSSELKNLGINVNCVVPGVIDTHQNREDMPGADFKKWVKPESITEVIQFLASDAASDIHGAAIPVYGRS